MATKPRVKQRFITTSLPMDEVRAADYCCPLAAIVGAHWRRLKSGRGLSSQRESTLGLAVPSDYGHDDFAMASIAFPRERS